MAKTTLKILVVDDDHNFANTLSAILRSHGYYCQAANSVCDAQTLLAEDHFDCVFSDVRMPDQGGVDLYKLIKAGQPHLPFILMTAYTSSEIIEEALESGVLVALQKPLDIEAVLRFLTAFSQNLQAAVICQDEKICDLVNNIFKKEKFIFTVFPSIQALIQSSLKDPAVVLVDAHHSCEHYSSEINALLDFLPKGTIVIVCDFEKTIKKENLRSGKINLVVLPRDEKCEGKIDKLLSREIYQYAKSLIHE